MIWVGNECVENFPGKQVFLLIKRIPPRTDGEHQAAVLFAAAIEAGGTASACSTASVDYEVLASGL